MRHEIRAMYDAGFNGHPMPSNVSINKVTRRAYSRGYAQYEARQSSIHEALLAVEQGASISQAFKIVLGS